MLISRPVVTVLAVALAVAGPLGAAESRDQTRNLAQFSDSTGNKSLSMLLGKLTAAGFEVKQRVLFSDQVESLRVERLSDEEHKGVLTSSMWERTDTIDFRLVRLDDQKVLIADIRNTTQLKAPLGKRRFVSPDSDVVKQFDIKIGDVLSGPAKSN